MSTEPEKPPAGPELADVARYAAAWQCDLGDGEWDHDWKETHESSGELDGAPGEQWSTTECRVCGAVKPHNASAELPPPSGSASTQGAVGG